MDLLEVTFACVFVVPYHLDGEEWHVRLKVEPTDDDKEILSVIQAWGPDKKLITGSDWDEKIIVRGLESEFWAAVINYMLIEQMNPDKDLGPVVES